MIKIFLQLQTLLFQCKTLKTDIGTTYDETDIYDGNPSPIKSTSISGSGDSISMTYVTNNTSPSHTIQAVTVTYGLGDRR